MGLLTIDYVKTNFPLWTKYFLDDTQIASDTVLQNEMDLADAEFLGYLNVTSDTITPMLKLDLLSIIKYRGFNRLLGDVSFETKPQIVRDYESAIARLQSYKTGTAIPGGTDLNATGTDIVITAKDKRFGEWFNNGLYDVTSLNS